MCTSIVGLPYNTDWCKSKLCMSSVKGDMFLPSNYVFSIYQNLHPSYIIMMLSS